MNEYQKLLRKPQWQKKRLEVMERDNFACAWCKDAENMLAVHHLDYITGAKPWEYSGLFLVTLCEACHNLCHFTGHKEDLKRHIIERHGVGTLTTEAVTHLFHEHELADV